MSYASLSAAQAVATAGRLERVWPGEVKGEGLSIGGRVSGGRSSCIRNLSRMNGRTSS